MRLLRYSVYARRGSAPRRLNLDSLQGLPAAGGAHVVRNHTADALGAAPSMTNPWSLTGGSRGCAAKALLLAAIGGPSGSLTALSIDLEKSRRYGFGGDQDVGERSNIDTCPYQSHFGGKADIRCSRPEQLPGNVPSAEINGEYLALGPTTWMIPVSARAIDWFITGGTGKRYRHIEGC